MDSNLRRLFSSLNIYMKNFRSSIREKFFFDSSSYWEHRYSSGGTSGSGSYGRLARFKADFLNNFVSSYQISSLVELGSGDGAQLSLSNYTNYLGVDVSLTSVNLCRTIFSDKDSWQFTTLADYKTSKHVNKYELALSLDVIYHLTEDCVFNDYMSLLFESASRFVIIYAYDFSREYKSKHERGRKFSTWISSYARDWTLLNVVKNPFPYDPASPDDTSQSDFFVYQKLP